MYVLKTIVIFLVCAVGLLAGVAFVLPSTWEVSRELQIQTHPMDVHVVTGDLDTWQDWSPWGLVVDNAATMKVGEEHKGVGATLSWSGPEVGKGNLKILSEDRETGMTFALHLNEEARPIRGTISYREKRLGETMVTFKLNGDVGTSIVGRYVALVRSRTMGRELIQSLGRLKKRIE